MSRYHRCAASALVAYWIFIFTMTHLPPQDVPKTHISDKIEHLGAYGLLGGAICLCVPRLLRKSIWTSVVLLAILAAYGAADETTQPFFHRDCDIHDWYADMAGGTIAVISMNWIERYVYRRHGLPDAWFTAPPHE